MARRLALIAHDHKKVDLIAWATFKEVSTDSGALLPGISNSLSPSPPPARAPAASAPRIAS